MTTDQFFKFVWRFNGIAIMLAAIVVTVFVGFMGVVMYRDFTGRRSVRNVVNVEGTNDISERLRFGHLSAIGGTSYSMGPLSSDQTYGQSYYEKSSYSTRNILFVNNKGAESHWLFNTNEYLVLNHDFVSERADQQKPNPVVAILYLVVKRDTNRGKRLTPMAKVAQK